MFIHPLDAETVTIERQGDALILRPLPAGGWDRVFADRSLVLPPEFEPGADPAPKSAASSDPPGPCSFSTPTFAAIS